MLRMNLRERVVRPTEISGNPSHESDNSRRRLFWMLDSRFGVLLRLETQGPPNNTNSQLIHIPIPIPLH